MNEKKEAPHHMLILGMTVVGDAGGQKEEVPCLDINVALAQDEMFKVAGYRDVMMVATYFVADENLDYYQVTVNRPVQIARTPKQPRYTRADINPGISVYDYDKDVLGRKTSGMQVIIMLVTAFMCMIAAAALPAGIALIATIGSAPVVRLVAALIAAIAGIGVLSLPYMRYKAIDLGAWVAGIEPPK